MREPGRLVSRRAHRHDHERGAIQVGGAGQLRLCTGPPGVPSLSPVGSRDTCRRGGRRSPSRARRHSVASRGRRAVESNPSSPTAGVPKTQTRRAQSTRSAPVQPSGLWRRPRIGHRWASSWRTDAGGKICSVCYIPFSSSFSFSTDQSGLPLQLYS